MFMENFRYRPTLIVLIIRFSFHGQSQQASVPCYPFDRKLNTNNFCDCVMGVIQSCTLIHRNNTDFVELVISNFDSKRISKQFKIVNLKEMSKKSNRLSLIVEYLPLQSIKVVLKYIKEQKMNIIRVLFRGMRNLSSKDVSDIIKQYENSLEAVTLTNVFNSTKKNVLDFSSLQQKISLLEFTDVLVADVKFPKSFSTKVDMKVNHLIAFFEKDW